jgi:peptide/nickel transport system permease protein
VFASWRSRLTIGVLVLLHGVVLLAGFVAPYVPTTQDRDRPYLPPMRIHFADMNGNLHWRPFVYEMRPVEADPEAYEEVTGVSHVLQLLVPGEPYRVAGLFTARTHLFGVDPPARIYLLGTDAYGRDMLSRVLHGGAISLFAGALATTLSLSLGTTIGLLSGLGSRWLDETLMRFSELFGVLPWVYLLFGLRAFLPLHIDPAEAFLLIVIVIGSIGWVRPARLVRGVVLSAKRRNYVLASRGFGASNVHILRNHLLPEVYSVLLTQASLLIPRYVVAEVTLSFLGLGLSEPIPSWGNLLANLQQYHVIVSHQWMFAPAWCLVVYCLAYFAVADSLQMQLKSASP